MNQLMTSQLKRMLAIWGCVSVGSIVGAVWLNQPAQAQTSTTTPTTGSSRASLAPCWIHLSKTIIVDAGRVVGFRTDDLHHVFVDVSGLNYLVAVDVQDNSHQDQYINQQRLTIAACFGDTTEGLGVGLPTR